jgi:O-antigen/teichoic acid export membrane protein
LSLPFVTSTAALIGLLEAHQRFLLITSIRIPLGLWTFLGPLLTLQFSPSLETATLVLVAGRIVATLVFFVMARRVVPELRRVILGELRHTRELLAFGGWLTLSNVVGPVLVYADRFLISALLGLTAVAYYATPFVVVSRLFVLPHALMGVLFPAFVTSFAVNRERLRTLTSQSMFTLLAGMLPLVAMIFLFAPEAMTLWLGAEFARHATVVARWLAIGALFNSLARIPLSLTTASGRPDLVAKLHLAEMLPYGVCLWLLMQWHGIEGAAMAWTLRVLVDLLALMAIASRRVAGLGGIFFRTVLVCALGTALLLVAFWLDSIAMRATIWLILTVALGGMLWRTYLPLRASEN